MFLDVAALVCQIVLTNVRESCILLRGQLFKESICNLVFTNIIYKTNEVKFIKRYVQHILLGNMGRSSLGSIFIYYKILDIHLYLERSIFSLFLINTLEAVFL